METEVPWKQLRDIVGREFLYHGKILNLRVDRVKFPSGEIKTREIIEHKSASAVLAVDEAENIFLVAQYRHAVDEVTYEIPAGLIENEENAAETAGRELQEEIGYKPGILEEILTLYSSPGFSDEKIYLFYATELKLSELPQDDDEHLSAKKFTLPEIMKLIELGKIKDCKTIAAIYWYALRKACQHA